MSKKFVCNGMLGKLCKLLRIYGIDTTFSEEGKTMLVKARREGRIVLTKNTQLRNREGVFFVEPEKPKAQFKCVLNEYGLEDEIKPFSRCLICNDKLVAVSKDAVREQIPYFTYKNFTEFAQCPNCHRVYWKGSHYENMLKEIHSVGFSIPNSK